MKKNRKQNNKGFTLLEMVLVMAIIAVFFTMVAFLVPVWYKNYEDSMRLNYARQIADAVLGAVEEQIRFADDLTIVYSAPDDDSYVERITGKAKGVRFYTPMEGTGWVGDALTSTVKDTKKYADGMAPLIDGLVYDEDFFMENSIRLSFQLKPEGGLPKRCEVTVQVVSEDGTKLVLQKKRTVLLFGKNSITADVP
jgi:prepilin-type N-terminal cleavage/methylation domain-containing protein